MALYNINELIGLIRSGCVLEDVLPLARLGVDYESTERPGVSSPVGPTHTVINRSGRILAVFVDGVCSRILHPIAHADVTGANWVVRIVEVRLIEVNSAE